MGHIPVNDENFDYLENKLKTYQIGQYIIAAETKPYDHYHFIAYMSDDTYRNFAKSVFKDKFKLRGQARNGLPRQYGKTKDIKDPTRMMAYTVKDGNFRTDFSEQQIEALVKQSFEKKESKDLLQECIEYVEQRYTPYEDTVNFPGDYEDKPFVHHGILIIGFLRSKQLSITPASIKRYYYHVNAYSEKCKLKDAELFKAYFPFGL